MTDAERIAKLESGIAEVGRDRVFHRARLMGWRDQDQPPIWVWEQIVYELRMHDDRVKDQQPRQDARMIMPPFF